MLSNRMGLRTHLTLLFSVLAFAFVAVAPAPAEEAQAYRGEPTDPEKMLVAATANADDLEQEGVTLTPPADANAFDAWYQTIVNALVALGLLPPEDSTP
jgi:hypothetical protein